MDFTEEEMEKQYAPSQWSRYSKSDEVLRDFISETVRGSYIAKNMIPGSFDVSYGKSDNQKVDIFGENKLPKEAPVFVFVHGGFWIEGSRQDSSFPVRPLYEAGILCIVMGYDLISDTFTLPELVTQIQCGIKFVLEFAEKRGSRGVYFCGHSAGSHLIAMALSSDPPQEELYKLIKGLVLFSGIYSLVPLLKTSNARAAHITQDIAEFCSPTKAINTLKNNLKHPVHIWIAVAEHDSPAFQKQSEEYAEALQASGIESVQFHCFSKGLDHFSLVQNLYDKDYFLSKKLVDFVKSKNLNLKHEEVKIRKKIVRKSFDLLKNADKVKSVEHLKTPEYLKKVEKQKREKAEKEANKENINVKGEEVDKREENEDDIKKPLKFGTEKPVSPGDMESNSGSMETTSDKEITENEDNKMEVTESEERITENKDEERGFTENKSNEQDSVEDKVNEKLAEIDINEKQVTEIEANTDAVTIAKVDDNEAGISKIDNEAEISKINNEAEISKIDNKEEEVTEVDNKADITTIKGKGDKNEVNEEEKVSVIESNREESGKANRTGDSEGDASQKASEEELKQKEDVQSRTPQNATCEGENAQKMASDNDGEKEPSCENHDAKSS